MINVFKDIFPSIDSLLIIDYYLLHSHFCIIILIDIVIVPPRVLTYLILEFLINFFIKKKETNTSRASVFLQDERANCPKTIQYLTANTTRFLQKLNSAVVL